jgi:hypothetical protein
MKSFLDDGSSDASWSILATVLLAKTVMLRGAFMKTLENHYIFAQK